MRRTVHRQDTRREAEESGWDVAPDVAAVGLRAGRWRQRDSAVAGDVVPVRVEAA